MWAKRQGAPTLKTFKRSISGTDVGNGGGSDTKPRNGGTINFGSFNPDIVTTPVENTTTNNTNISFSDVSDSHWAKEYINTLKSQNIINGDESGKFNPENNITRDEFAKMLVVAAGLNNPSQTLNFNDIDKNRWQFKYISIAVENGIVKGINDTEFGSGMFIKRQDMAVMCYNTIKIFKNISTDSVAQKFSDYDLISKYAIDSIDGMVSEGIISGNENNMFLPNNIATKAEAAKLVAVMLSCIK